MHSSRVPSLIRWGCAPSVALTRCLLSDGHFRSAAGALKSIRVSDIRVLKRQTRRKASRRSPARPRGYETTCRTRRWISRRNKISVEKPSLPPSAASNQHQLSVELPQDYHQWQRSWSMPQKTARARGLFTLGQPSPWRRLGYCLRLVGRCTSLMWTVASFIPSSSTSF